MRRSLLKKGSCCCRNTDVKQQRVETAHHTSASSIDQSDQEFPPFFQIVVVCLVVLDAIFVLVELLLDLSIIKLDHDNVIPEVSTDPFTPNSLCFHCPGT